MAKQKSQFGDGHHAPIGSAAYMEWLGGLPEFLREIVAEERGIDLAEFVHKTGQILVHKTDSQNIAVQKVDDLDFSDLGGVRLAA